MKRRIFKVQNPCGLLRKYSIDGNNYKLNFTVNSADLSSKKAKFL